MSNCHTSFRITNNLIILLLLLSLVTQYSQAEPVVKDKGDFPPIKTQLRENVYPPTNPDATPLIHSQRNTNANSDECTAFIDCDSTETQKLTASDAANFDRFGQSSSISNDWVIVGSEHDKCSTGSYCGSAYVYNYDGTTWSERQKLIAYDTDVGDNFGHSVSISGDRAIIGAPKNDCAASIGIKCGSAYIFRFDGINWLEEQKLIASDALTYELFGVSVSINNEVAIVGASSDECLFGDKCGSVYVYRYDGANWVEEQKLTAFDADAGDDFGHSVSISGDRLIVGAIFDDCETGLNCGSAYIYEYDGINWTVRQKLTGYDTDVADHFGGSVSVSGDFVFVGASRTYCIEGPNCGSAYFFHFDGTDWIEKQKLIASDTVSWDYFGRSVSIDDNLAVVSAHGTFCAAGNNCGSVYLYYFDGLSWIEQRKLTASDAARTDLFGSSVSISDNHAIVSTPFENFGSTYIFNLSDDDCMCNGSANICDIQNGAADHNNNGVPDGCELSDCNENGIDDIQDIVNLYSSDCDADSVPDECQISLSTGAPNGPFFCTSNCDPDCNDTGIPDICDIDKGALDNNNNDIPDECELFDCNQNKIHDTIDIENSSSLDCDNNGIPDECQIPSSHSDADYQYFCLSNCDPDCNINGVPDVCELFDNDCNFDNVPDECGVFIDCDSFESQKLTDSEPNWIAQFGRSVAISGDRAAIASLQDNCVIGGHCGSVTTFFHDGMRWVEKQKLTFPDSSGVRLGISVSIDGDRMIAGASENCPHGGICGTAFIYRFDGMNWFEEQKLIASDVVEGDYFGFSVSISGNRAIVGAFGDDCASGDDCGSAYIFYYDGTSWIQEQKLTDPFPYNRDQFGFSVSISGNRAIVGVTADECHTGLSCGSAYIYHYDGTIWVEEKKIFASDATRLGFFGSSVSISGNRVVIGARNGECPGGIRCGSAYVYYFDGIDWIEQKKLIASDFDSADAFGTSVSINGDRLIVGERFNDCVAGDACGSAYIFRFDGVDWIEERKLLAFDATGGEQLGYSVSINGDRVICGAVFDDCEAGASCGSAYIFNLTDNDCNCNGYADLCENDNDSDADGIIDDCDICLDSLIDETLIINGCDTNVTNIVFDDGCTMADMIAECKSGIRLHDKGKNISCTVDLANDWLRSRLITGQEFSKIVTCNVRTNNQGRNSLSNIQMQHP